MDVAFNLDRYVEIGNVQDVKVSRVEARDHEAMKATRLLPAQ